MLETGAPLPSRRKHSSRIGPRCSHNFADNRDPNSLASRLRAKRNVLFKSLLDGLPRPLKIWM